MNCQQIVTKCGLICHMRLAGFVQNTRPPMFTSNLSPRLPRVLAAFLVSLLFTLPLSAQVSLTGPYAQDFNAATPAALPGGWLFAEAGTNANATISSGTGSSNAGDTYLLGTAGEWALGGLQSGSLNPTVGAAFTNNTGATVTELQISYTGETWRVGATNRSDRLDFQYSVDATSLTTGTWTDVNALDYANPGQPATGSGSQQHAAALAATITGLSIPDGATFYLRWTDFNAAGADDAMGVDNFSLTPVGGGAVAPTVTDDPDSVIVAAGDNAVFNVSASGTAPLSYLWRKDGNPLADGGNVSGATTATLTLTNVQAADQADYSVFISNAAGDATSAAATLTVVVPVAPAVTTPPASQTVLAGGNVTFNVAATGTAPLSYQWNKNGFPIGSATGASLTLTNVQAGDAGNYTVTVTNSAGNDTSAPAMLTVVVPDLYWNLAAANFGQDWSVTTLITANDNWSAVPSIIGYLGQDITTGTGTNPQTLTGTSAVANDVDVIANQANPNGLSSGGVAEFDGIANPTIALQGSGTGDAPHLVIHLDTRGRTNVSVAANLRDLDGSNDNAAQPVALQYRVGDIGPFTNLPDAFVADATQGPALNSLVTPVLVTLPADADNQPKVQVRFMTTNAVGNDEWVGIDDLVVSSVSDGIARVFASPTGGDTLVHEAGLTTDTYTLRLNTVPTGPVTVRASAAGQTLVSADGLTFGPTADIILSDLQPKLVHVQAADDTVNEAATHFSIISHAIVASGDAAYSGALTLPSLTAGVVDDDGGTGVTRIHVIQGSGPVSPLVGYQVTINGVVTGFFTGALGTRDGFFVQELDANADGDPATSEGVYVFLGSSSPLAAEAAALNVGDVVTVTGKTTEFNSLTEVDSVVDINVDGTAALPVAAPVTLPLPAAGYLERYEGMRISLPQTLTVTDNYDLGRFGQVILANGRLFQPTNIAAPGAPAQTQLIANLLNQILLDDGTLRSNPDPTPYLFDDGSGATLRAGDTTTGASGVLTYQFGAFMLQPETAPIFSRVNTRPATSPAVGGSLRITIGNVLNLFNGDGAGGGFPTSRGATNFEEYQRQLAKTVAGILAQAPDVMGLTEVENDGFGPASALAQLVAALNAAAPVGTTYAYVDASAVNIVTDVIHCAFIYRVETVETVGAPAMLSSPYYNNHARNPLAQTFREKATGAVLTVSINHFRAKASVSSMSDGIMPNPNIDQADGQGANNWLRTREAEALAAWLATDPTSSGDPDFLIIGDLNAYAQEDPITALKGAGYVNLTELYEGAGGYSYSFDGAFGHLDHALASPSLAAQATGAATWHVNSDEPIYYDYNTEDKSPAQQAINTGTPYRYSDHDPVIVGLNLTAAPTIIAGPAAQTVTVGDSVTFSVEVIGYPAPTYQWRRNGVDIPGADGASYTITNPVTADAGSYDVVITNSAGSTTSSAVLLTVNPAPANLTLAGLTQAYDGTPRVVTATTVPPGLPVVITYAGSLTPPVNPGIYPVTATINHPDYTGTVSDSLVVSITALVRHAPVLNGGLDGSLQVLLPENVTLNGNAWVSGDLLAPGTPTVRLNGQPTYGGTIDGDGAFAPSGHTITLNGGAVLRHVVRRTDALSLPVVAAPPAPAGTRNVSLNSAGQSPGDFATLRNLTLNGNAGEVVVPPGTYGAFTANGNSRFVFGVAGGTEPEVYNLQGLTLNGGSRHDSERLRRRPAASGVARTQPRRRRPHLEWQRCFLRLRDGAGRHGHGQRQQHADRRRGRRPADDQRQRSARRTGRMSRSDCRAGK
jgi:predicted extracellular nuclease